MRVLLKNDYNQIDVSNMDVLPRIGESLYFCPRTNNSPSPKPVLHKIKDVIWYPPSDYTDNLVDAFDVPNHYFNVLIVLE